MANVQKAVFHGGREVGDMQEGQESKKKVRFANKCTVRHLSCDSELEDGKDGICQVNTPLPYNLFT